MPSRNLVSSVRRATLEPQTLQEHASEVSLHGLDEPSQDHPDREGVVFSVGLGESIVQPDQECHAQGLIGHPPPDDTTQALYESLPPEWCSCRKEL